MKLDVSGLSVSDVLRTSEAEVRKRGLVEPDRPFVRDPVWWESTLINLKRYAKWWPMDELPAEYHITKQNPHPPLLLYGIPVTGKKLDIYEGKHKSEQLSSGKLRDRDFAMHLLSRHVQHRLRIGYIAPLATDYLLMVVLHTNYNIDKRRLVKEDEEDVISMVKEVLELDKDVRPRWDFDYLDPSVPAYGNYPME